MFLPYGTVSIKSYVFKALISLSLKSNSDKNIGIYIVVKEGIIYHSY